MKRWADLEKNVRLKNTEGPTLQPDLCWACRSVTPPMELVQERLLCAACVKAHKEGGWSCLGYSYKYL